MPQTYTSACDFQETGNERFKKKKKERKPEKKSNVKKVLVTQSCLTLCDPMNRSLPGSSVHGILQARILVCIAMAFSRGSSRPRDWSWVSCVAGRFFTIWAPREARLVVILKEVSESPAIPLRSPDKLLQSQHSNSPQLALKSFKKKIGFQLLTDKSSFCTLPFPGRTRLNPAVAQKSSEVTALVADYITLVFARRPPNFLFCSPMKQPAIKT